MKIPRKADLISLQQIYKTDDKIAEALGGIPEYLVAYWRRKKGVPPWTEAKFSEQQIRDLWERFGDDFRCGRELNLSKAAFYSWRRKYGILEKPAELKLEQLELRLPGDLLEEEPRKVEKPDKPHTSTAKILARAAESWPEAKLPADWICRREGEGEFAPYIFAPGPKLEEPTLDLYAEIPAADARVPFWLSPWRGDMAWQLVEARAVLPGQFVTAPRGVLGGLGGVGVLVLTPEAVGHAGSDSPAGTSAMPALPVVRIEVTRRIPAESDVEDIILAMIEAGWHKSLAGRILELVGPPIERLSVDRKVKLCAALVALGAAAAIVTFDDAIRRHYGRILQGRFPQTHPDRTAVYDEEHFLEGRGIEPKVGICENGEWTIRPAAQAPAPGGIIVGPDALPYEIELCAQQLAGRHVGPNDPPVIVCPATLQVYHTAFRKGWAQTIVNAGGSVADVALGRRVLGFSSRFLSTIGRVTNLQKPMPVSALMGAVHTIGRP
ncbi:MAG TPA: aconitase family protein [bacterium]|nr:aconitase family protein [bacterium]